MAKLLEKDPPLTYESNKLWNQIVEKRYIFDLSKKEAEELKNISKHDVVEWYKTYLKSSSPKCQQLLIRLWGCNTDLKEVEALPKSVQLERYHWRVRRDEIAREDGQRLGVIEKRVEIDGQVKFPPDSVAEIPGANSDYYETFFGQFQNQGPLVKARCHVATNVWRKEEILKDTKCVVDANNDNVEHERKNKNRANTSEENDKDCELGENQKGFDDREGSTKDKR
ncbi:hypothetical protein JHK82_024380 [Glycine max]|nr:hypothetical protein JHK85_024964 [Glycine max]KAG5012212.1 hypothetical protein JHK86_024473 [Glycine max]KAG5133192.1 hypothetical protein JHK82_024380 [Glycine max]